MKINKETREQMKIELEAVFNVIDQCEPGSAKQRFIESSSYKRGDYWVKAHLWSSLPSQMTEKQKEIFKDFPQNSNHELYPCGSNDASLGTALKAIAKEFSINN